MVWGRGGLGVGKTRGNSQTVVLKLVEESLPRPLRYGLLAFAPSCPRLGMWYMSYIVRAQYAVPCWTKRLCYTRVQPVSDMKQGPLKSEEVGWSPRSRRPCSGPQLCLSDPLWQSAFCLGVPSSVRGNSAYFIRSKRTCSGSSPNVEPALSVVTSH